MTEQVVDVKNIVVVQKVVPFHVKRHSIYFMTRRDFGDFISKVAKSSKKPVERSLQNMDANFGENAWTMFLGKYWCRYCCDASDFIAFLKNESFRPTFYSADCARLIADCIDAEKLDEWQITDFVPNRRR